MSHPLFLKKSNLLFYAAIWLLIAIFHFLILQYQFNLAFAAAFLDSLVSNALYAGMALSFWYPCRYISLEQKSIFHIFFNHAIAAAIAALIWLGAIYLGLVRLAAAGEEYRQFFQRSFPWRLFIGALFYFVTVAFYYLLIYYQNFQEKLTREAELKSLVKEAELKTLKFQINPHFIFNSLNSVNSLILTDPPAASRMTVKLSEFLRATLSGNEKLLRTLEEELATARLYLDIEKIRFGEKIIYREEVAEECRKTLLPAMLLQPLLENAVKHGVYESLEPVTIKLFCGAERDFLAITMENNYESAATASKGEGIGLKNIRSRLEMMYSRGNLLQVEKEGSIFRVKVYIPVEKNSIGEG